MQWLWLTADWWHYLLSRPSGGNGRWLAFWCRAKNHPNGVRWYTLTGLEPDTRCVDCDDNLG